jgi:cytochrome c oxidase subunit 2
MSMPALHDVLRPVGREAWEIIQLWNLTLTVCAVVFAVVVGVLAIALVRRRRSSSASPQLPSPAAERAPHRSVGTAVLAAALLLVFLSIASFMTDRAIARASPGDALTIEVTGYRWWWQARYGTAPDVTFDTANEIHVPTGRPVLLQLRSADVIHSFWAPSLQGKKDLIPGRTGELRFQVDRPGRYRGQCAEFCGLEHATMAFEVVADAPAAYAAWEQSQLKPAVDAGPSTAHGREVFLSSSCGTCHTVRGTDAAATVGPDLTHLASRRTIAAGTLPNDAAALRRWIRDPQALKPGANMPPSELSDADLTALAAWLETLR